MFFISAGIYVFGMLAYSILGRCELQTWAVTGLPALSETHIHATLSTPIITHRQDGGIKDGGDIHRQNSQSSTAPMLEDTLEIADIEDE